MNSNALNTLTFRKKALFASLKIISICSLVFLIVGANRICAESAAGSPSLEIPQQIAASPGGIVTVPVNFRAIGNAISAVVFSVDYDEKLLSFDPADSDGDGIPDAIRFNLPGGFNGSVVSDANDTSGELDFMIADVSPPLSPLPDGELVTIRLNVSKSDNSSKARVGFSKNPKASFGSAIGKSIQGNTRDGSVHIKVKDR